MADSPSSRTLHTVRAVEHLEMRMLAALMVSMTLLTTVLFAHAVATADERPAPRPGVVTIGDPAQQRAVASGR
jgi:hypothetical protein